MDNQDQISANTQTQEKWASIAHVVETVWGEIFETADKILKVHLKFGFEKFADKMSPSLEDILLSLKTVESVLDTLHHALDYTEQRMSMNAKQQILWVQDLAEALQNGDERRYQTAIEKMSKQAVI